MSRPLISDFPPRQCRRVNWWALVRPGYYLAMISLVGFGLYTCNAWRSSADNAVNAWAQRVGVE